MVTDKLIRKVVAENQDLFIALEELDRTGKLVKTRRKERVTFTIDEEVIRKFRTKCKNKNMSQIVEGLIEKFMDDLEFARRTNKALKEYEQGKGGFVSMDADKFLEELKTW